MELATLPDVRILVEKHLPKEYRSKFCWRQLAGLLKRAAEGPHSQLDPVTSAGAFFAAISATQLGTKGLAERFGQRG
jgi:hypothetical protein